MKLPRRNFLHLVAGAAALPTASSFAWAQAYPTRPVRLIARFPDYPFGRCDGHHEMVDVRLRKKPGDRAVLATIAAAFLRTLPVMLARQSTSL